MWYLVDGFNEYTINEKASDDEMAILKKFEKYDFFFFSLDNARNLVLEDISGNILLRIKKTKQLIEFLTPILLNSGKKILGQFWTVPDSCSANMTLIFDTKDENNFKRKYLDRKLDRKYNIRETRRSLSYKDLIGHGFEVSFCHKGKKGAFLKSSLKYKNDFQIINNNILIDNSTKLMWQRCGTKKRININEAIIYIEVLNEIEYEGYSGWRLPTIPECTSIDNIENFSLKSQIFNNVKRICWTHDISCGINATSSKVIERINSKGKEIELSYDYLGKSWIYRNSIKNLKYSTTLVDYSSKYWVRAVRSQ
jgi:hypothetical protein